MKVFALLVLILLGMSVIRVISNKLTFCQLLGLSFPVGTGIMSLYAFFLNISGAEFNQQNLLIGMMIFLVLSNIGAYMKYGREGFVDFVQSLKDTFQVSTLKNIQIAWVIGFVGLVYVLYAISMKSMFWPTIHYDAISGYDLLAKKIFYEGSIQEALFNPTWGIRNVRTLYPPLIPYSLAYAYEVGFEYSKVICVLFYLSVILSFYAFISDFVNPVSAIFFTFFLAITPELLAQSAMVMTNIPHVSYTLGGLMLLYLWIYKDKNWYLALSILMLSLGIWAKTETILFSFPAGLLTLIALKKRNETFITRKNLFWIAVFALFTLSPFVLWELYSNSFAGVADSKQPISYSFSFDMERIKFILSEVKKVTWNGTTYYGYVVYFFIITLVAEIVYSIVTRKVDKKLLAILFVIFFSWFLYLLTFYQLDLPLGRIKGYINASYKRSFFNFLPLMVFYAANTTFVVKAFSYLYHPLEPPAVD